MDRRHKVITQQPRIIAGELEQRWRQSSPNPDFDREPVIRQKNRGYVSSPPALHHSPSIPAPDYEGREQYKGGSIYPSHVDREDVRVSYLHREDVRVSYGGRGGEQVGYDNPSYEGRGGKQGVNEIARPFGVRTGGGDDSSVGGWGGKQGDNEIPRTFGVRTGGGDNSSFGGWGADHGGDERSGWTDLPLTSTIVTQPMTAFSLPQSLQAFEGFGDITVSEKVKCCPIIIGPQNTFMIQNEGTGRRDEFKAKERSNIFWRYCCGPRRKFDMTIFDSQSQPALLIKRPLACWPFTLQSIDIFTPDGDKLGSIQQKNFCLCPMPILLVTNASGTEVFHITGPCVLCICGCKDPYKITTEDGQEVGRITKHWSGCCQEYCTTADNFSISFPTNIDIAMKAVILAAAFLIDYIFYEVGGFCR